MPRLPKANLFEVREWTDNDWKNILLSIRYGKCTPFLGAGACYGTLPLARDIAKEWAMEYGYPLEDSRDLARVAQFVAVEHGQMRAKFEITEKFKKIKPPDFTKPDEPHAVLADLPLPIYITTNYDDFMVKALKSRNKESVQELCRWNSIIREHASVFKDDPGYDPTSQNPMVFHLHGHIGIPASLVLTEDDYLDFLVSISKYQDLIPARIQRAFRETSFLFLGYKLNDWNFRVLFRSLAGYMEKSVSQNHVAVQLVPKGHEISDEHRERALNYLEKYFDRLSIHIYWGTCQEFVKELREQWQAFKND